MGCTSSSHRADKEIQIDDVVALLEGDPHGKDEIELAKEQNKGVNKSDVSEEMLEKIEKWFQEEMLHEASSTHHASPGFLTVELTESSKTYKIQFGKSGPQVERTYADIESLRAGLALRFPTALIPPLLRAKNRSREAREQAELVQFFLRLTQANPWFRADHGWKLFIGEGTFDQSAAHAKLPQWEEDESLEKAFTEGKSCHVWHKYISAKEVPSNALATVRSAVESIKTLQSTIKHVKDGASRLATSNEKYGRSWNNFAAVTDRWAAIEGKNLPMMSTNKSSSSDANVYAHSDDTRSLTDTLLEVSRCEGKQSEIFGTHGSDAGHSFNAGMEFEIRLLETLEEKLKQAEHKYLNLRDLHNTYRHRITLVVQASDGPDDKGGKKLKALRAKVISGQKDTRLAITSSLVETSASANLRAGRLMAMVRSFGLGNRALYKDCLKVWNDFENQMGGSVEDDSHSFAQPSSSFPEDTTVEIPVQKFDPEPVVENKESSATGTGFNPFSNSSSSTAGVADEDEVTMDIPANEDEPDDEGDANADEDADGNGNDEETEEKEDLPETKQDDEEVVVSVDQDAEANPPDEE